MKIQELIDYIIPMAKLCAAQDEFGALHIVVSDGNLEDEHIEFCLQSDDITEEETKFARKLLEEYTEEQRAMVWEFSQCDDI